jgi:hypothetical protein
MAKLIVNIDTETGLGSVEIDGKPVEDVYCIEINNWGESDEPRYHFSVQTSCTEGDVCVHTRLVASEREMARAAVATGEGQPSKTYAGLTEIPAESPTQQAVADFYESIRCTRV